MAEFLCPLKVTHIIEACSSKALLASLQELSQATQQRVQELDQVASNQLAGCQKEI